MESLKVIATLVFLCNILALRYLHPRAAAAAATDTAAPRRHKTHGPGAPMQMASSLHRDPQPGERGSSRAWAGADPAAHRLPSPDMPHGRGATPAFAPASSPQRRALCAALAVVFGVGAVQACLHGFADRSGGRDLGAHFAAAHQDRMLAVERATQPGPSMLPEVPALCQAGEPPLGHAGLQQTAL